EINTLTAPQPLQDPLFHHDSIGTDGLAAAMVEENPNCTVEEDQKRLLGQAGGCAGAAPRYLFPSGFPRKAVLDIYAYSFPHCGTSIQVFKKRRLSCKRKRAA
ncbi:MAG: hypothetical protein D3917_12945, partial [Candidatus Electrothrix sp. AX5]|nr:hypothetical protein [Candidatus Electrothrix sp. AX5]